VKEKSSQLIFCGKYCPDTKANAKKKKKEGAHQTLLKCPNLPENAQSQAERESGDTAQESCRGP
jgi:hypothetical protein